MSRQSHRHPNLGQIDRRQVIKFRFDGLDYEGYAGDTLASALLANGVRLFGRSFKYHRPRGILSAGSEEPNALVEVHEDDQTTPNCRATMVEIYTGLVATSQNRWPSLAFDVGSVLNLVSRFLSAGFYYKTFIWPSWKFYEWAIRRSAGLGKPGLTADNSYYERQSLHCDVLVVGAGQSGIKAASDAAKNGDDVVLVDENPPLTPVDLPDNVRLLTRTTASAYYDHNLVACVERVTDHLADKGDLPRERLWRIRARAVVLASGAIEQPIVFNNNDRPGIMLASAVRRYIDQYGVLPGKEAVIFTDNDDGYQTALALLTAGASVIAVIDRRPQKSAAAEAAAKDLNVLVGHAVVDTKGRFGRLAGAVVQELATGHTREIISCNLLAMSGGWMPALHLFSQSGGKIEWDESRACFVAGQSKQAVSCVGRVADTPVVEDKVWEMPDPVGGEGRKKFIDFQNDVTADDVRLAHHEGFISVEHLKRYTALGMGTEQGKTSNLAGHAMMAQLRGSTMNAVGTTTFRPPFVPVTLGLFGGRSVREHLTALRLTPMDDWNEQHGSEWIEAGHWRRPRYYDQGGDDIHKASMREVRATRGCVGVCDVSTLGKIEVKGPDAGDFLNRVYTNGFGKLPVGKARYGLMLREDGILFDDGTTSRLSDDHYFMTTTSGGHGHVMDWLEFHLQAVWPDLRVKIADVTDQWAGIAVAGPKARDLLAGLVDIDISNDAVPFLGVRDCRILGVPGRLFRISFSGELGYELNVPADYGEAVWQVCVTAAESMEGTIYGLEALDVMRIEKGHITGGELDGRTTAIDCGLEWMLSSKKHFIGKGLMSRPALSDPARKMLVGLVPVDKTSRLKGGAQIVARPNASPPVEMLGHITSAAFSPELDHPIALAMIKGGEKRLGEKLYMVHPMHDLEIEVEVTAPVFVDPEGKRIHG